MRSLLLATATLFGLAHAASAATFAPYTPAALQAAQDTGKPVVVEVYAPWCPICARQQPILKTLEASPKYADVTVLRVDFDHQQADLRALHVAMQSTLIAYHGHAETGRLVGVVRRADIEQLFTDAQKA